MGRRRSPIIKTPREIAVMRDANRHVAEILEILCDAVEPGISTWELDRICRRQINRRRLDSPYLRYFKYPASVCTSVNEEVVHGVPRKDKILDSGDIIGIDLSVGYRGYVGDAARTIAIGAVDPEAERLIDVTRRCLDAAIAVCTPEHRLSDIGRTVQSLAERRGYGVVREFVGHGIGRRMHEEPDVPSYYEGPRRRLRPGLVIAIEPMITMGHYPCKAAESLPEEAVRPQRKRLAPEVFVPRIVESCSRMCGP